MALVGDENDPSSLSGVVSVLMIIDFGSYDGSYGYKWVML
jgi:hypothetical protein